MCGIIGVLTTQNNAEEVVIEGIELLQNRGYDSAGIVTMRENEKVFTETKLASDTRTKVDCIDKLKEMAPERHRRSFVGIGHTRWATCGGKTDQNAHPHMDQDRRVALVHNGTIDNYKELKEELAQKYGTTFRSETDSEIVAQWIGVFLKEGLNLMDAVHKTVQEKLIGQWGLVVIDREDPEKIVVCRQGSPILIGLHEESIFIASEKIAFEKMTQNYISVKDGEIIELDIKTRREFFSNQKHRIFQITDKAVVEKVPRIPYRYFFEQEIYEQPETLMKALGHGSRISGKPDCTKLGGLERHINEIRQIENMVIVACGSSYYASMFAAHIFKKLQCFNSLNIVEGSEFTEYDLPLGRSGMICVSQSGETADIRKGMDMAKKAGLFTIGAINSVGSQIATGVDCGVYLNCGREVAVAATKSFTSQVIALIMIAVWVSYQKEQHKGENKMERRRVQIIKAMRQMPLSVGQTLWEIDEACKSTAKLVANQKSIIVLGKGACSAIAKEGALKLKELTYIHAEAFSAGELKHGPLALIDAENPKSSTVMLIILDDENFHEMHLALSEVESRGASTIVITDCKNKLHLDKVDVCIEVPEAGLLTPLLCVLPFQKITYEICNLLERNPDKPRNLAKCVTVK